MFIAYDTKFHLKGSDNEPELYFGIHMNGLLSLSTKSFRVEYDKGEASVHLARYLTSAQMKNLGEALISAAHHIEEQEKQFHVVSQNIQTIPLPPGVTFTGNDPGDQDCD